MKNLKIMFSVMVLLVALSCNDHKSKTKQNHGEHSHDEQSSHSHNDYFGAYALSDDSYKTKTTVTINGDSRMMITNAMPNHKTGSFPNKGNPNTISAQNRTYTFPLIPKYTGNAQWVREPGVALNGVKFEPRTAEVVTCDTGENYRVEALQDVIDLGLDFNHAHVQPTGAYHYHGTPTSVVEKFDTVEDLVHIGFAHDGFPMYYSKSNSYKPSFKAIDGNREGEDCTYENPHQSRDISIEGHHDGAFTSDFEYVEGSGDLDECNGVTIEGKYMYLVTNEFPYVSRCLMGEIVSEEKQHTGMQAEGGPQNGNRPGQRPSAQEILKQMDINTDGKLSMSEVKGPIKYDFSKIDANNDVYISLEELEKGAKKNRQGSIKQNN